jgi:hypothetical protein
VKEILVSDDELQRLEKRFGSAVRHMGPWSSDGTFGYASVSIIVVEKAVAGLDNPDLAAAVSRLTVRPEQSKPFIELLEAFGARLIERIVAAYRECSREFTTLKGQREKLPVQ